jgi:hypothetical protein
MQSASPSGPERVNRTTRLTLGPGIDISPLSSFPTISDAAS